MKRRNFAYLMIAVIVMFAVSGCETVPKKFKEEVGGIKSRVDTLETRVDSVESRQLDTERSTIEKTQSFGSSGYEAVKSNISVKKRYCKSKSGIKEVQRCLKNAGFYEGKIDGIKGKNTKRAIKEFQTASGLKADGIVGPKTWEVLCRYAEGSYAASSGTEEGATK